MTFVGTDGHNEMHQHVGISLVDTLWKLVLLQRFLYMVASHAHAVNAPVDVVRTLFELHIVSIQPEKAGVC